MFCNRNKFGDLRGMLGHAPVLYTSKMVANELRENSRYGDKSRDYLRWIKRALNEQMKGEHNG